MQSLLQNYNLIIPEGASELLEMRSLQDQVSITFSKNGKQYGFFPYWVHEENESANEYYTHTFLEIIFIMKGKGVQFINGLYQEVVAGEVYFIHPDTLHTFTAQKQEPLDYINFSFLPEFIEPALSIEKLYTRVNSYLFTPFFSSELTLDRKLFLSGPLFNRMIHFACMITDLFNTTWPEPSDQIRSLFKTFIVLLVNEYKKVQNNVKNIEIKREFVFRKILKEIEHNIDKRFNLDELARAVGLSVSRTCELFKEIQGETIIRYVNRRRIERSLTLLKETDLPIIDIAFQVGFNDLSHFNSTFKKLTSVTPREYRKEAKISPVFPQIPQEL